MLWVAGGAVPAEAGRVDGVLTDGAVCAVQPKGKVKQWRGLRRFLRQVRNQVGQEVLVIWERKGAGHHLGWPPSHLL